MPKFVVNIERVTTESVDVEVTAADEDTASEKATKLVEADPSNPKFDWQLDDVSFDTNSCDEA